MAFTYVVRAQDATAVEPAAASDERQLYDALIDRYFEEFSRKNWLAARTLLLRAHTIHATARTWRGLGITAFSLHDYAQASNELERALSCPVRPLDADLRAQVTNLLERASHFVARYRLTLTPPHARLIVDHKPALFDEAGRALLDLGEHVLTLEAPSYVPLERRLQVSVPGTHALTLSATPVGSRRSARTRPFAWLTTSVAAAAFASAFGVWKVSDDRFDALRSQCAKQLGCYRGEVETGQIRRLDRTNAALLITGSVLAVGATVLWIVGAQSVREPAR